MTRSRSILITMTVVISLVLAFGAVLYVVFTKIKSINESAAALQSTLEFDRQKQDYLISTGRVIQNANSDISQVNNSIIPTDNEVPFIEEVETLARSNGLQVSIDSLSVENSDALDAAGMAKLNIKAKVVGGYASIRRMLSQFEALPIKMIIQQADIQTDRSKDKPTAPWELTMTLYALKYK